MKQVKLRDFQHHLTDYLKELPLTITSYDKPIADVVVHVNNSVNKSEKVISFEAKGSVNKKAGWPKSDRVTTDIKETTYSSGLGYKPVGLNPLPEDGTDLAIEGLGKCQVPNIICHNQGAKYRLIFYDSDGEVTKELFLCDLHIKKARQQGMEVGEI